MSTSKTSLVLSAIALFCLLLLPGGGCTCNGRAAGPVVPQQEAAPRASTDVTAIGTGPSSVAPAAAPPARIDLGFLARKMGPPLPRDEIRAGERVVLGGFVRGLTPSKSGQASFRLVFDVRAGNRKVTSYDGPVTAPFDIPEEQAVRLDLGIIVPADTAPGPANFHVQVEEGGKAAVTRDFPFEIIAKNP